jgi:hypothetical protein
MFGGRTYCFDYDHANSHSPENPSWAYQQFWFFWKGLMIATQPLADVVSGTLDYVFGYWLWDPFYAVNKSFGDLTTDSECCELRKAQRLQEISRWLILLALTTFLVLASMDVRENASKEKKDK